MPMLTHVERPSAESATESESEDEDGGGEGDGAVRHRLYLVFPLPSRG